MIALLPPLPAAVPLVSAGLLLTVGKILPGRIPDAVAILTALGVAAADIAMALGAAHAPLVYWFGDWLPRANVVPGIGFVVGQADAAIAGFIALLFAASFSFAWSYFAEVRALFHVLMLLFLAAMEGFCLTHDLFNLFVWFELMSVAAFALTAYRLEASELEGALNFTVTNTLGSFLMLTGIALMYLRGGALDFAALGRAVGQAPQDPVIVGAFCLVTAALLIKGAAVPFHFWLDDAHAVAPSPVSVIFSGAMVPIALFGIAKLYWEIFAAAPAARYVTQAILLDLGGASAILGGIAALRQRHLKRLLAFSTISHCGILLIAIALANTRALGGMLTYFIGHGLVKGALFMIAGILLGTLGGIDEIGLRGRGRAMLPVGIAMALGALLLGGAPVGLLDEGSRLIDTAASESRKEWIVAAIVIGAACTGAAVLRSACRIFLGWGELAGEEKHGPTEAQSELADRPLSWMMVPVVLLLLGSIAVSTHRAGEIATTAAARFIAWDGGASLGALGAPRAVAPAEPPHPWVPWVTIALSVLIAAHDLARKRLPRGWLALSERVLTLPVFTAIDRLHNGVIGDYVAWMLAGLALLSLAALAIVGW
jgi:multicomponent Na+:H+ antiporter subunit D